MLWFLFAWLPLCFVVAWLASEKGRSGMGFFFLALLLSPLVGLLAVIALPAPARVPAGVRSDSGYVVCRACNRPWRIGLGRCPTCGTAPAPVSKTCPACAEQIQPDALKCRYCGHDQRVPVALPAAASIDTVTTPTPVAPAMGACPGCRKLRASNVRRCVYCGSTEPAAAG